MWILLEYDRNSSDINLGLCISKQQLNTANSKSTVFCNASFEVLNSNLPTDRFDEPELYDFDDDKHTVEIVRPLMPDWMDYFFFQNPQQGDSILIRVTINKLF